jgi:hypothetical protein
MSTNDRDQVTAKAIEDWRKRLIDPTGKNRLLNFRKTRTGTLRISVPECQGVTDRLLTGRLLGFNVWMIQNSQGLAFRFESGNDLFGIHAQLDDF